MRELIALYQEVVQALHPRQLMRGRRLPQPAPGGALRILGLGKIAAEMAAAVEGSALLAIPRDAPAPPHAQVIRGGHPLPDEGSLQAGEALLAAARTMRPEDAVLLLISGGGSALAEAPHPPLALAELRSLYRALVRSGAPIEEMNCVRAHLSRLKGGGLARALYAAGVRRGRALVAVDVPVGGTSAVSSGPAAADPTTSAEAAAIAREYALPPADFHETLKPGEPADFIEHEPICDLRSPALEAVRRAGATLLESPVRGDLESFARKLAALSGFFAASGELEVRVPEGAPEGGRDQHLALLMARELRGKSVAFLAAGTDGRDGPTDSAGAAVDGRTWEEAERRGLQPAKALEAFDASRVLMALGLLLPARHTGAHAGDLFLLRR